MRQAMAGMVTATMLFALLVSCDSSPLLATKPTPPAATSPRAGATPVAFAFPPRPLEKKRSEWLKAFVDGTSDAPSGSPELAAWQIGAWWAIVDWCAERGRTCEADAAEYVQQVMGTDPRSLNDCGWAHAIGGVLGDGYDVTSGLLYGEARTPVRLDHLFERHEVKPCPE